MIIAALISPTKRASANRFVAVATTASFSPFQRREVTLLQQSLSPVATLSALIRPAHQLEGRFDVPPSFGLFAFALLFQGTSLLGGLGDGLVAMCFQ